MCETRNEAFKNRTEPRGGKVREPSAFFRQKQPPAAPTKESQEGWTVKKTNKPKQKQL